jgi:hypothetical protein
MMMPPQSPGVRWPAGRMEVKTMGAAAVPLASILAPRRIQSELPVTAVSPTILVPASMVRVAPFWTLTYPLNT